MDKKELLIAIYRYLYENTCYDYPITYTTLSEKINEIYCCSTTRKSVASCVDTLNDCGIEVLTKSNKGVYLASRPLESGEIKFLIDCILSFNYIDKSYSEELIKKLCCLGGKTFNDKNKLCFKLNNLSRGNNKDLFYNVEILDEAIVNDKKVTFTYNKYKQDKKLHKTNEHIVSPFFTFLVNQCYYLMGASNLFNDVGFFRIDKITNVKILDEKRENLKDFKGYANGLDLDKLLHSYPYMFAGKLEMIEFLCDEEVLDDVINKFGKEIKIKKQDDKYKISLIASVKAMEYYLLQYGTKITVISPQSLVDKTIENVKKTAERYGLKIK